MHWQGHVGAAAIAYAPVGARVAETSSRLAAFGLVVAVALSTLPDVDHRLPIDHRSLTHTVWFVAATSMLASAAAFAAAAVLGADGVLAAAVVGSAAGTALASHLLVDVLTPMGIRPFEPLSSASYTFELVYSKNRRANRVLLLGGGAAIAAVVLLVR